MIGSSVLRDEGTVYMPVKLKSPSGEEAIVAHYSNGIIKTV
jgi:hypothetical protein